MGPPGPATTGPSGTPSSVSSRQTRTHPTRCAAARRSLTTGRAATGPIGCPPAAGNLVHVEPGSDQLLLKAYFVVAGTRLTHTYFLIERYRPLSNAPVLAER